MNVLPIPLELLDTFELVLGVVVILVFFVLVFWLNVFLFEKLIKKLKKEESVTQQESYNKALDVLADAKEQSFKILNSANTKAQDIIHSADALTDDTREILKKEIDSLKNNQLASLNKAGQDLLASYREVLSSEKEGSVRTLKDVSEDLKEEVVAEFEEFTDSLEKNTFDSEKLLEAQTNKEYAEMRHKMQEYEKDRLQKIDSNMLKIIARVSKQVLGEALSMEKHADLVIQALQEAKEESLFND